MVWAEIKRIPANIADNLAENSAKQAVKRCLGAEALTFYATSPQDTKKYRQMLTNSNDQFVNLAGIYFDWLDRCLELKRRRENYPSFRSYKQQWINEIEALRNEMEL